MVSTHYIIHLLQLQPQPSSLVESRDDIVVVILWWCCGGVVVVLRWCCGGDTSKFSSPVLQLPEFKVKLVTIDLLIFFYRLISYNLLS